MWLHPAVIQMYHVTNQTDKPDWETIEACSIANDKTYDGDLLGLPLASFTTTLNEYEGRITLPTKSPYPRCADSGNHQRMRIRFNMNDYHIFLMKKHKGANNITQIQLLCIRKTRSDDDQGHFEDEVYGILLKYYKDKQLTKESLNIYFPNGEANVFRSSSDNEADRMIVNVHFTYNIKVDANFGASWDTVAKLGGTRTGDIDHSFDDISISDLRSLWCMKHHWKTLNDKIIHLEGRQYNMWQIIKPLQSELKKAFDQWEDEVNI